ncbi:hypothetical protein SLNWT_1067 [Streptomyces albus]|uniref:Peptidoglycan-binding protein n=1 Tax=Streptomyces albus (strain ATCC 21838 / DSM 41398 / FERM P-419 / JCM 4703 / NBRC 107858) TaxID=1081613 RepID=A0A0B5EH18_STRA4|nr:hypothetical protein SLNWT_1067 [Streptomyces albus]AOU75759.1 hypothetical protein SLNHY_1068 [Streptomyces albus]
MNKVIRNAAIGTSALALAFFSSSAVAQAASSDTAAADVGVFAKLSHSQAASQLSNAGIGIRSSGGCSDRNTPTCTSLEQVNSATIQGAITLKGASGCALTVTGGTEVGHASGTYSHWNGYKLDFAMTSCLTNYITGTFTSIGGGKWQSGSGNIYYNESNHWDVTYHNCGGC